jgi:hypothetical protein
MSSDISEQWKQIVKYSSVANGTALTLALSSIGKTPVFQLSATIGKFPIWCFFLGLVASGLHLLFSFAYNLEAKRNEANATVRKLTCRIEELRSDALSEGALGLRAAKFADEVQRLKDQLSELDMGQPDNYEAMLRNAQELVLWASYGLFFAGLASVVWSS